MLGEFRKDLLLFYKSIKDLKVNKIKLSIIFISLIVSKLLNLLIPLLFGNIINGIINKSIYTIKINLVYMFFVFVISTVLSYITSIMLIKLSFGLESNVKVNIFTSILKIPYTKFLKIDKGKLINNIEEDSTVFSKLLSDNMNILISFISLIISFLFMLYISPLLTLILIITFPITGGIFIFSGKKIKEKEIASRSKHDGILSFLNESFYGWKFLKLFNAETERINIFNKVINSFYKLQLQKFKIELLSQISTSIVSFFINVLNILIAVYLIFNGSLTLGMLTAFNEYSETFKGILLMFSRFNSTVQEISVSITRSNEVLKYDKNENSQDPMYENLDEKINTIELKDLTYNTMDNNKIFQNVNLNFSKNNIYVIKGESGSGKSTLLNIMSKFIDDYSGDIHINNINLKDINMKTLRNKVNYITQDNYIFSLSIKENISLYRDISFDKIKSVCKSLNLHDTVMSLPNQYDTIIHKDGSDLSGGEKQRLCIARAIVNNPDVYLFDEITSAIDKKNVNNILRHIEIISKDSIVILTSHEDLKFSVPIIEYHLVNKKFETILATVDI